MNDFVNQIKKDIETENVAFELRKKRLTYLYLFVLFLTIILILTNC
jgi:hypothetical protein